MALLVNTGGEASRASFILRQAIILYRTEGKYRQMKGN